MLRSWQADSAEPGAPGQHALRSTVAGIEARGIGRYLGEPALDRPAERAEAQRGRDAATWDVPDTFRRVSAALEIVANRVIDRSIAQKVQANRQRPRRASTAARVGRHLFPSTGVGQTSGV